MQDSLYPYGKGKEHDFSLFKASGVHFHEQTQGLADKGYQGLQKLHPNSLIPIKKPKNGSLSKEDKRFNRQLGECKVNCVKAERYTEQ